MTEQYQSNALWPKSVYSGIYGNSISTDTHATLAQAEAVCRGLLRDGFGGQRQHFPLRVWVSGIEQPPKPPATPQP